MPNKELPSLHVLHNLTLGKSICFSSHVYFLAKSLFIHTYGLLDLLTSTSSAKYIALMGMSFFKKNPPPKKKQQTIHQKNSPKGWLVTAEKTKPASQSLGVLSVGSLTLSLKIDLSRGGWIELWRFCDFHWGQPGNRGFLGKIGEP